MVAVHPRVCGEQGDCASLTVVADGSSPRVRGTDKINYFILGVDRFIPACAGNRRVHHASERLYSVHPRVCGEQGNLLRIRAILGGSSPRVRGTDGFDLGCPTW